MSLPIQKQISINFPSSGSFIGAQDLLPSWQIILSEESISSFNCTFLEAFLTAFKWVCDMAISHFDPRTTPPWSPCFKHGPLISGQSVTARMILFSNCFPANLFSFQSSYSCIIQTSAWRISAPIPKLFIKGFMFIFSVFTHILFADIAWQCYSPHPFYNLPTYLLYFSTHSLLWLTRYLSSFIIFLTENFYEYIIYKTYRGK